MQITMLLRKLCLFYIFFWSTVDNCWCKATPIELESEYFPGPDYCHKYTNVTKGKHYIITSLIRSNNCFDFSKTWCHLKSDDDNDDLYSQMFSEICAGLHITGVQVRIRRQNACCPAHLLGATGVLGEHRVTSPGDTLRTTTKKSCALLSMQYFACNVMFQKNISLHG